MANRNDDMFDRERLEHTQPMEPVMAPDHDEEPTQLIRRSYVRELDPVEIPRQESRRQDVNRPNNQYEQPRAKKTSGGSGSGKLIMGLVLAVVFVVAILAGFMISGYQHEKNQQETAALEQQQSAQMKYDAAKSEQGDLLAQRRQLEAEIAELEEKQKQAQSAMDKLKGANEQIEKEKQEQSAVGKVLDKVSGKDAKQKADAKENTAKQEAAAKELENIGTALENAHAAIHTVNSRIDEMEEISNQAIDMKNKAEAAYAENKDTIDTVIHYLQTGVEAVKELVK